jgi:colicin import membrane protein
MKTTSDLIYFGFSMLLHLILVLFLLFRIFIFPSERPELIQSIRVDMVALPDKDPQVGPKEETPAPAKKEIAEKEKEEKKPEVSEKPAPKEPKKNEFAEKTKDKKKPDAPKKEDSKEKTKDQQNSALDRLKALAKLKDKKAQEAEKAASVYKGNVLSDGNALTGVDKLQHDQYLGKLDSHIKNNWKLPAWLTNKPLSTSVLVRFDAKGLVLEKKIVRSSGNSAYDSEALQAVTNSAPFPEPPEHLVSYFKVRGIELRFPE